MKTVEVLGSGPGGIFIAPMQTDRNMFARAVSAFAATWQLTALAFVAILVVMIAMLGFLRGAIPSTTTYISRMQFTFPGVGTGRYPNGDLFTVNEIIDPAL